MQEFDNGEYRTKITYVIARYSRIRKKWYEHYEYEEIEDAKRKLSECRKYHPKSIYGLFEKIKSETINKIAE